MFKNIKIIPIIFILSFLIFLSSSYELLSQGMNNKYPIDSVDIENVIRMLGMEVFKFPINKQSEKSKLKIIMKNYDHNKLSGSTVLTQGLPYDDLMNIHNADKTLRIYTQRINDSLLNIQWNFEGLTSNAPISFSEEIPSMLQCRAYTKFQPQKGQSVPALVIYGYYKNSKISSMHCSGDSPVEFYAESYDFVIAMFLEIEEIK